ncbi:MAG: HAMP domain-containing histidine kinase [Eubacterium sp.]|jgi:signal transduction histidine kinase|nr:HAMP domain-containing histidine kinase [Eubacterium sp.]
MEKERWQDIIWKYLGQYKYTAAMFAAYTVIFAYVLSLYSMEIEAVAYAAGLCVLLTVLVLGLHLAAYRKKHLERRRIAQNIKVLDQALPEPETLAEADYQEMIVRLKQVYDEAMTAWQQERQESMDYYTTWVHQIKTPISVMHMTLQAEDTAEHRELSAELFRIEQYAEMVLSYLRLGSDASDFVIQEYRLDDIIREAIHKYAPMFVRRHIRLFYEPAECSVLTDKKWLLFIMEQILSNAVKYTQEGSVQIAVTPEKVLNIADTGIGIAKEDIPRIFEKGFTGYNGRADKKSTGLGLYLCRKAADKLMHPIRVESEPGKGTVFSIDLYRDNLELL